MNNTCIQLGITGSQANPPVYATVNGCDGNTTVTDPRLLPNMGNNRIFNPFGLVQVSTDRT